MSNYKIAVLVHLFYTDMWEDIKYYLNNLGDINYDLYINLVDGFYDEECINQIKKFKNNAHIVISPNKGEDIGGFLYCYKQLKNNPDFILKIHTKKSLGTPETPSDYVRVYGLSNAIIKGKSWFHKLMNSVLKSKSHVTTILDKLENDKDYVMCGLDCETYVGPNISLVEELGEHFKIPIKLNGDRLSEGNFVGGTIFWVKNSILKKYLTSKNIEYILNKLPENYHNEPSYNHAMERILGLMVNNENKKIFVQ